MKNIVRFVVVVVVCSFFSLKPFLRGRSFFAHRSQSVNGARHYTGLQDYMHLVDSDGLYGMVALAGEYTRSFSACKLAEYFFGSSQLTFSGSRVFQRGEQDILADYFGLPTDFSSTVCFKPRVENILADLTFHWGFDCICDGLYLNIHAPLVRTAWNMRICEKDIHEGSLGYPSGYMSSDLIQRSGMVRNVTQALRGTFHVGDIEPLRYGKVKGEQTETKLSEIHVELGRLFLNRDNYYLGAHAFVGIPTGNASRAEFLFEPIVGNGKHWEFGFGAYGHVMLCGDAEEERAWSLYGKMNVSHLFDAEQRRSYDLRCNGPGSRYILIQEMGVPVVGPVAIGDLSLEIADPVINQYHGKLMPAINKTLNT